ncbi:hypothetical protein KCU88_g2975, partial [Aureobasidium melanogenum]
MRLTNFIGVAVATLCAPAVVLADCGSWDVRFYTDDVCGNNVANANNYYIDSQIRTCESLSGFSVDLKTLSLSASGFGWEIALYDNDDCTCDVTNPFGCPTRYEIPDEGDVDCHDVDGKKSFSVQPVYSVYCGS